jgi:hypothetical protein
MRDISDYYKAKRQDFNLRSKVVLRAEIGVVEE